MGGLNLELFKFSVYVMFPIGWMYYFGTNLDGRFSVPDFWPRADESNTVPTDRGEITAEASRIVEQQRKVLALRAARDDQRRRTAQEAGEAKTEKRGWFW